MISVLTWDTPVEILDTMVHVASRRLYVIFIIFGARHWIWLEYGIRNQINVDSIVIFGVL